MHCLLVLPFAADKGAQGRKSDAIETLIEAHNSIGVNLSIVSLEPEPLGSTIYASLGRVDRFGATLLKAARYGHFRHAGNRLWRARVRNAVADSHKVRPINLSFAVSMLRTPSIFVHDLWRACGIPYVVQEHRSVYQRCYSDRTSVPERDLGVLDNAKAILALTECHARHIRKVTSTRVEVAPLALPASFFEPSPARQGQEEWTIAAWNNWRELKRLDLVITAFVTVASASPLARLAVAGPIPAKQLAAAQKSLEAAALSHRVSFLGALDREGIKRLAYSSDVCVVASDHETFSIPASEALAAGCPIVVTRCGGPESFVDEGVNGFSVPVGDADMLADRILKIARRPAQFNRKHIATAANAKFSVSALSDRLAEVYRNLGKAG